MLMRSCSHMHQIRDAWEPETGIDVKVTQVECDLECGAIKMIQQVPTEVRSAADELIALSKAEPAPASSAFP